MFPLLALAFLAASLKVRRAGFLLVGVLLANAWAWFVANWPLRSLYGLLTSTDRVGNLALVQVVAAGNPLLQMPQAGQLTFEPFWSVLVAVVSGFDPERVLALYPFLPLVMILAFAGSLHLSLRGGDASTGAWSGWECVTIAAFATLLSSAPFEYAGTYRLPWPMTFLLKPNHALGLVLLPPLLRAFAEIRGWRSRIAVGVLLQLLGWVFVIHMAFVAAGLLVFAAASVLSRHPDWRRDSTDAVCVIGVNVLVVSPYLVMLAVGYPFLYASPRAAIPPFSPHLLEASLKQGLLFWLGLWGCVVAWRRGDRLSRVLVTQLAAAYAIWASVLLLSLLQIARERDEIYYWVRILTAAVAGIGAWDLARRVAQRLALETKAAALATFLFAAALPWSLPYWWDPLLMDSYVPGSLEPLPDRLRLPTDFIRRNTAPAAIFAGDRDYARFVAALGARRVTLADNLHAPKNYAERVALEEALVFDGDGSIALPLARSLGVSYFVATRRLLGAWAPRADVPAGQTARSLPRRADFDARPYLARVFLWEGPERDFVAIYRIAERAP